MRPSVRAAGWNGEDGAPEEQLLKSVLSSRASAVGRGWVRPAIRQPTNSSSIISDLWSSPLTQPPFGRLARPADSSLSKVAFADTEAPPRLTVGVKSAERRSTDSWNGSLFAGRSRSAPSLKRPAVANEVVRFRYKLTWRHRTIYSRVYKHDWSARDAGRPEEEATLMTTGPLQLL